MVIVLHRTRRTKVIEISDILDNKHTLQALLDLDQI